MNRLLSCLLLILVSLTVRVHGEDFLSEYKQEDHEKIKEGIALYEDGQYEKSIEIFDDILKVYPNDYTITYERTLALYKLKRYDEVIETLEKLVEAGNAKAPAYQLYGNALDLIGKPNDAIKVYARGIEQFPDAGNLYLEIGNVYYTHNYKDEALRIYNLGIEADPNFASNYFRAANIYFDTDTTAWGLIYAESEILLNPNNIERREEMARSIVNCYDKKAERDHNPVRLKLSPTFVLNVSYVDGSEESETRLGVPGVVEACYNIAIKDLNNEGKVFDPNSFTYLIEMRRKMVENYFELTDDYFGKGMYLLQFEKKVIDAGHWEAYNYFIFSEALTYYCETWFVDHREDYNKFIDWYNDGNIFKLEDGRSVGELSSLNYARPLGLMEGLLLTSVLTVDED